MRYKLVCTCITVLLLMACNKKDDNVIMFRVQNATGQNLNNVAAEGYSFGNLPAGAITKYTKVVQLNSDPGTHFYIGTQSYDAGSHLYLLVASYLPAGKYTLKIYKDTLPDYPYNSVFIKE